MFINFSPFLLCNAGVNRNFFNPNKEIYNHLWEGISSMHFKLVLVNSLCFMLPTVLTYSRQNKIHKFARGLEEDTWSIPTAANLSTIDLAWTGCKSKGSNNKSAFCEQHELWASMLFVSLLQGGSFFYFLMREGVHQLAPNPKCYFWLLTKIMNKCRNK